MTDPNLSPPSDAERAVQTQAAIQARAAMIGEAPLPLHIQSREAFKQQILPSERVDPQKRSLMSMAIDSVFDGLGELVKHGHVYTLIKHDPAMVRPQEWPKMMYSSSGEARTFGSQQELDKAAAHPDASVWFEHPTDRPDEAEAAKSKANAAASKRKAEEEEQAKNKAQAAASASKK